MQCQEYSSGTTETWDRFVEKEAWNATFLHSRRFLSYHGDRFDDVSLLVNDEQGRICAVFPAAIHPGERELVVSHPGATFGGLVAGGQCRGEKCISALGAVIAHYRGLGFKRLRYKVTPYIYHAVPFQDDLYALFRLGFRRVRCDISATVAMHGRAVISKGRKYEIAKAKKLGIEIVDGVEYLPEIYALVVDNLRDFHQTTPVHSVGELLLLHSLFPEKIQFLVARLSGECVAGVVMFNQREVAHTQYISSNEEGRQSGALDLLIEHTIGEARSGGVRYFDFGISNELSGLVLNDGLYRYKRSFGSGSVVHEFYDLDL